MKVVIQSTAPKHLRKRRKTENLVIIGEKDGRVERLARASQTSAKPAEDVPPEPGWRASSNLRGRRWSAAASNAGKWRSNVLIYTV